MRGVVVGTMYGLSEWRTFGGERCWRKRSKSFLIRSIDGVVEEDQKHFELLQEYCHLNGIIWRSELSAHCRLNLAGDWDPLASASFGNRPGDASLVSMRRAPIEEYLAASKSVLVRMFDFDFYETELDWADNAMIDKRVHDDGELSFRFTESANGRTFARGVQIVGLSRPEQTVFGVTKGKEVEERGSVAFISWDWRNRGLSTISTDPSATTSYSVTDNKLPFDTSPAFFDAEVLLKYKSDRERFVFDEERRVIRCRGGWSLRSVDVNEANQVHAFICDLRKLPIREQKHWESFNEKPKASISQRTIANDFKGTWFEWENSLKDVRLVLRRWLKDDTAWWNLSDESMLLHVNTPLTGRVHEWSEAIHELCKLVVDGFRLGAIRSKLQELGSEFDKSEQSIALLERFLRARELLDEDKRLGGLRELQLIRTKVKAHQPGKDARALSRNAIQAHG